MALYLFLLVGAGGIVFFVWNFRRKIAEREAASKARFDLMLYAPAQPAAPAEPAPTAAAASPSPPSPSLAGPDPATAPVAPAPARERFLGQAETLLYYLLKSGIPDHEVFAHVSLASVVGASGSGHERDQQLRRLAQYRLDFVVCDKSMRIIAAVEVDSAVAAVGAGEQQFKADYLGRAGIRLVRINLAALPKREQIRALVGGPDPAGSGGG